MEETHKQDNPVELAYIKAKQDKDKCLKELLKSHDDYHTKIFHEADKDYEMICRQDKIAIPQSLKSKIIEWYHHTLLHPGEDRTFKTIN